MYVLSGLDTTIEAQDLRSKTSSTAVPNSSGVTDKTQSLQSQSAQRLRMPHRGYIQFIDVSQLNATFLSSPSTGRAHSPVDPQAAGPSPLASSLPPPVSGPSATSSSSTSMLSRMKSQDIEKPKDVKPSDREKSPVAPPSQDTNKANRSAPHFRPKYIGLDTKFRWTVVEDKQVATVFTIVPAQIDTIEATLGKSIYNMYAGHFEYDLLLTSDSRIHLHAGPVQLLGPKIKGRNLWKNLQGHAANNSERHGYWEQFKVAPLVIPSTAFKNSDLEFHNSTYNEVSNCMNIQ